MTETLYIENARVIFPNFSGTPSQFNKEGNRTVCAIFENRAEVEALREKGFNVKVLTARDEGEPPRWVLTLKLGYSGYQPPRVYMVEPGQEPTPLSEDTVSILDSLSITHIDASINPYEWVVKGERGLSAYVKAMYVHVELDQLDAKYANLRTP